MKQFLDTLCIYSTESKSNLNFNSTINLCMKYSDYKIDNRVWLNFPECTPDNCPLLHPELLNAVD